MTEVEFKEKKGELEFVDPKLMRVINSFIIDMGSLKYEGFIRRLSFRKGHGFDIEFTFE